jgi:hypothetical protein
LCVAQFDPARPDDFCDAIYEARHLRDKNRHHWMYNECSLGRLLLESGFSRAYRCPYRQGECPDVEILDSRPENSLYMEAVK